MKATKASRKPAGYWPVAQALLVSNAVSLLFGLARIVESGSDRYWFLTWNLFLAWLPLMFAWWLVVRLRTSRWLTWQNIILTALWLAFLPNSFYMVSDLIHIHATGEVSLLYDVVMFCSFIFNAYVAGFVSLFYVHRELLRRTTRERAHALIGGVLLACSLAIYLGRSLRWNSWDIVLNPFGLLFDVSDRLIHPVEHVQFFVTTAIFFALLSSMYFVIWRLVTALKADNR